MPLFCKYLPFPVGRIGYNNFKIILEQNGMVSKAKQCLFHRYSLKEKIIGQFFPYDCDGVVQLKYVSVCVAINHGNIYRAHRNKGIRIDVKQIRSSCAVSIERHSVLY